MSSPYYQELEIASLAVQRASLITKLIAAQADKGSIEKNDRSPVTVADFAVQALVISAIHDKFPEHGFVGEESATALRNNPELLDRVWTLVSSIKLEDSASQDLLATPTSKEEMLDIIDLGKKDLSSQTRDHFWILDPIDGTSTFMSGGQYAICVAFVENGKQKVGVLGCPNLSGIGTPIQEYAGDRSGPGIMFSAVINMGAYLRPLSSGKLEPAQKLEKLCDVKDVDNLRFVESPTHPAISPDKHRMVAEKLGLQWPDTELWAMQLKYAALALGAASVAVRIPPNENFRPYVWDHAGGQIIFEEAGGKLTDLNGKPFDFAAGKRLVNNFGLVAAPVQLHGHVFATVQEVLNLSQSDKNVH